MTTDQQYQRLMNELKDNGGVLEHAAMRAAMHRNTARKYVQAGQGPKQLKKPHMWRTREDPIEAIWPEAQRRLEAAPGLEARELFKELLKQHPGGAAPRAERTFRRRVARWRRKHGPEQEVSFPQNRQPGKSMQLDWTDAGELGITIAGEPYAHRLCHSVLPYSNAEWAIPCLSESTNSLIAGAQAAYGEFGGVTEELQTDQSSTATHQLRRGKSERGYNKRYRALCDHLRVDPRTIARECPDQNGDVESLNGHLKRRLEQKLLLRGTRDFASEAAYGDFVAEVCRGVNAERGNAFAEERKLLRPLPPSRFPDYEELTVRVSCFATVRVKKLPYSVPSRLIGAIVEAFVNETEVVIRYDREEVARHRRRPGKGRVNYRHVIKWLVRKPGAFAHYQHREDLFPQLVFRHAYDRLLAADAGKADRQYLRVLELAYDLGEDRVTDALGALLRDGHAISPEAVKARFVEPKASPISLDPYVPSLRGYDRLLKEVAS
jgi:transposase